VQRKNPIDSAAGTAIDSKADTVIDSAIFAAQKYTYSGEVETPNPFSAGAVG
jgi:hypothetical protein